MKSYKITGLQPSHLASRDDLFNLDSEWRDLTFPTDGDTWEADDSNESELRLTCAQCGCCLEEAPEDGVVYCPDCGGEFFYVSRLITRQIVEVSGVSAYLSSDRFLHFKLPPSLPEGYQLYYTWGEEKPSFQSARYTTPRRCPDGVTKIQYLLLFPDDTCTRVMQDVLTPPAEALPPCPICGQQLAGTNDRQFCPACQYRERYDSKGKLVSSGSHILCPGCNKEFDTRQADTNCPSCGIHIYFQPNVGWNYDTPANAEKPDEPKKKMKGSKIPIITFVFLLFTTPWFCSTFPVLSSIIMAGIMISVFIFTKNIKKERKRKNICTAILCAIIVCCCGMGLLHINSPQYEWEHVSRISLHEQLLFLKNHPKSANRKKLSKAIVKQLSTLSDEQIDHLPYLQNIDEGAAYRELTATPTIKSLHLFLKLFPETSDRRKQKLSKAIVKQLSTLSDEQIDHVDYLQNLDEGAAYKELTATPTIKSLDLFLKLFPETSDRRKQKVYKLKGVIEKEKWLTDSFNLNSCEELVAYRDGLTSEEVKALVDQRIAELEENEWTENYANSSSEATLLRFQKTLRSEKVKQLVNQRLQELYSSFDYARNVNTIEAYERFIQLSFNPEEIEEARRRIVDLEVAEIARGQHSALPPQHNNASQYTRTGYAEIELENETAYPLIARYSGTESKKITIPALGKKTITIRSGEYAIAVTTTQPYVIPFYGKEYIDSGKYQVSYYISSSPSPFPHASYP